MDKKAKLDELEATLWTLNFTLQSVYDQLNRSADVKDRELFVGKDWLEFWLDHEVLNALNLEVAMLESVNLCREEGRNEDQLA